jgi:CRP-like cAMP-binding protein
MVQNNKKDISQLIAVLNYFNPVSDGITAYFEKHVIPLRLQKGDMLLQAGTVCEHFYFIKSGAVRGFMIVDQKDITTWITVENELVTSITSLDLEIPALENIQAIEDCELLALKNTDMQKLYQQFPEFNITGRKLLQQYYRDAEGRAYIVRLSSAEDKYNYFIDKYNHLSNRIPLKYIASYIGITVETLSRVRKKLSSPFR